MTTFDLSPLFRTAIGFDRLTDLLETAHRVDTGGYPPYNIQSIGEDRYRISLAVAGFTQDELEIEVKENLLKVAGKKSTEKDAGKYLHRGIATRNFERTYQLADYVRVEGAEIEAGVLHIDLLREIPEAMKPRRVEIRNSKFLEGKKVA